MPDFWNRIPGPASFVRGIADHLRQGMNVVVLLPEGVETDFAEAIRKEIDDTGFSWHSIDVDRLDSGTPPIDHLFDRFLSDTPPDLLRNAHSLGQQEAFESRIICLRGPDSSAHWRPWKEFLVQYEVACRAQDVFERALFFVLLSGDAVHDPPPEDTLLAHHRWRGRVDSFDMLLYAAGLLGERYFSTLEKHLSISLCAQLALWDREVCRRLTQESFEQMIAPHEILADIARQRGWCDPDLDLERSGWEKGIVDEFDGRQQIHSAFLAEKRRYAELNMRIWSAQVKVLFPHMEEHRIRLLRRYEKRLRIPYVTARRETIDELLDLEIGHIDSQFRERVFEVEEDDRRLSSLLKKIRNDLAHLTVVELSTLRRVEEVEVRQENTGECRTHLSKK